MIPLAQKHAGSPDFTRGFSRHGLACFEDAKNSKIAAFSGAQICPGKQGVAQITLGLRQSTSEAATTQPLKDNAPGSNPHRPR
jgi:hypothetical protein